ncbi:MAG: hypothetical protein ACEQSA_04030 [Weeksellaceae bacterium]
MKKLLSKINFKVFSIIFFSFFLLEYGSAAINAYQFSVKMGMTSTELLQHAQLSKYIYRFIFYGLTYWVIFEGVSKKKEGAYYLLQILLILHILSRVFILVYSLYSNVFAEVFSGAFVALAVVWNIIVIAIYVFFITYLYNYRKKVIKNK